MPLAKHHEDHTNATIGHPRAYELFADLGFADSGAWCSPSSPP
ncbi:hypothetical protein SAMN05444920_11498 [Nonomuraea solani]|uniref:Uncharacterized protein n=1 Tax=Nonomuraea solani TaxID=1144553 RepID=A0A1H6EPS0_9ACTN|nr:hypothetical protein [Nonomuraea solani]SEG99822.1 hypothetical protein SAMN05444920_11498 [Nonomuraea solani]